MLNFSFTTVTCNDVFRQYPSKMQNSIWQYLNPRARHCIELSNHGEKKLLLHKVPFCCGKQDHLFPSLTFVDKA
jgi:hypothetical protein